MNKEKEKVDIKEMIQSLYQFATKAFGWAPKPPGGRASVTWLAQQLGRGVFNSYRSRLSFTCARAVIFKWKSTLDMASAGVAMGSLPKWA